MTHMLTCKSFCKSFTWPKESRVSVICSLLQFLTNVFMIPYMALRERIPRAALPKSQKERPRQLPSFSKLFGGIGFVISAVSIVWLFQGRPEFGGFDARLQFAIEQFSGNRAFWAFVLDLGLYSFWQAILMGSCGASNKYRYVPFFGLAAWLIADAPSLTKGISTGFWDPESSK